MLTILAWARLWNYLAGHSTIDFRPKIGQVD